MTREEFMSIAQLEDISSEDYTKVEKVYCFHPYFESQNKTAIAIAYNTGGMGLIEALLPPSEGVEDLYCNKLTANFKLNKAAEAIEAYDAETQRIIKERELNRMDLSMELNIAQEEASKAKEAMETYIATELEKFKRWCNCFNLSELEKRLNKIEKRQMKVELT